MRLKNVLIVVKDIEKSAIFYKELFGLQVILDQGETVIMTEGLVLQEAVAWKNSMERDVVFRNNAMELYFEENNMEAFVKKLEDYKEPIEFVMPLTEYPWGKKVLRFYDLDGVLIEVGTPG